ncbi:MAG: aminoacetone oxidase family FAD-binding enzyme [Sulfurimonas sp.]|nr:aminoacetone oxidase family FAD-binding enzyme [Sulfurimonas sp.]MBU3938699.1 aminoacetone oxidase family FAD-binding enzyme [bacterium]MBU4024433.1 aminoacetone oxidase family FAD-binding enzyme [bacterium]MBU4058003.1 aminoacetone oxidase family FAD-binding enzyme [bacterium]MBU4111010.1 aminoacetone oxidase family FAD-binding enzyme [bacterium]
MKIYDVLILGAGASGLMCAAHLNDKLSVAMVEGNEKVAKKLKISGGGKCNITNVAVSEANFDGDSELVEYALSVFSKEDLLTFLEQNGIEPEIRKERYYFCQESSDEIIKVLKDKTQHFETLLNAEIFTLKKVNEIFELSTSKGILKANKVVVATGGKSYKSIGASEIGLDIAKSFGIKVKEFTPALVGMTLQKEQFWMKELSGLSCYVNITVADKVLKEEMLFAHKGISGPAVLSASLYWHKGNMSIDFLPELNIFKLIEGNKKLVSSAIPLPKRLSKELLKALDVEDVECRKLGKEGMEKLKKIHNYEFAPAGNFGFTKAEVSRGGVLSQELNRYTLESLDVPNLYFIGEVVDVTGELGGYNFQWAFSSGVVCANSIF